MSADLDNAPETLPILDIRVLDLTRKSSFRVRQLKKFPVVKTIAQLRNELAERLPDLKHVQNCQFGYVLERNKKYSIGSDNELQTAFGHFRAGFQMWLDPTPLKRAANPSVSSSYPVPSGKYNNTFLHTFKLITYLKFLTG